MSLNQYFRSKFVVQIQIDGTKLIKYDPDPIELFKINQKFVKFNRKISKSYDFNRKNWKRSTFQLVLNIFDLLINMLVKNWSKSIKSCSKLIGFYSKTIWIRSNLIEILIKIVIINLICHLISNRTNFNVQVWMAWNRIHKCPNRLSSELYYKISYNFLSRV